MVDFSGIFQCIKKIFDFLDSTSTVRSKDSFGTAIGGKDSRGSSATFKDSRGTSAASFQDDSDDGTKIFLI